MDAGAITLNTSSTTLNTLNIHVRTLVSPDAEVLYIIGIKPLDLNNTNSNLDTRRNNRRYINYIR